MGSIKYQRPTLVFHYNVQNVKRILDILLHIAKIKTYCYYGKCYLGTKLKYQREFSEIRRILLHSFAKYLHKNYAIAYTYVENR